MFERHIEYLALLNIIYRMQESIIGTYSSGHYVTIEDEESSKNLKLLGGFGFHLESAHRKDPERRGPSDRWLIESKLNGILALSLSEAFYLAYALGCLKIVDSETRKELDLTSCWSIFRGYHIHSCSRLNFAFEYGVYHFFKSRDWVIKTGHNYGTNFLLYHEGPSIDHAHYAVHVIDNNKPPEWESLLTLQRVIQSVCKKLLLVYIDTTISTESPAYIRDMKLSIKTFGSITNLIAF